MTSTPSTPPVGGIHHITAIAGDPQRNLDFYVGVLGLRLVKKTVNFDDPGTYHLYYGDALGHPGTLMTFFPWPGAKRGQRGNGQANVTAFAIPRASLGYWAERLISHGVKHGTPENRFGESVLAFEDPDGLALELVTSDVADAPAWEGGTVPTEHAIRGFHSVTLWLDNPRLSHELLTHTLGFRELAREGSTTRYVVGKAQAGQLVDIRTSEGFWRGSSGVGTVHHVAFRADDDAHQDSLRQAVIGHGVSVTPPLDRHYFRSVYFREPGGVLFEVATDPPGFTVDESPDTLGHALMLPEQFEPFRADLEDDLPPLHLPTLEARV